MEMLAFEGIKDRINSLDWDEMQNLVAGRICWLPICSLRCFTSTIIRGFSKPNPSGEAMMSYMEMLAFEGIKDRINSLDWDEMQNLVAGVLRSMGSQLDSE
jgi:predicted Mrr-cat superfamily restriction endonuclease